MQKNYLYSTRPFRNTANEMMTPTLINWTLDTINSHQNNFMSPYDMHEALDRLEALPPLSGIGLSIMQLANDPSADTDRLAEIIEQDTVLSAQIMRLSESPVYGFSGINLSVRESISDVLGFDFACNLVFALSAFPSLKTPKDGAIGTRLYWIHAIASLQIMQLLNNQLAVSNRFHDTQLIQSGLMRNIGLQLLSDQFPSEFGHLNNLASSNPTMPIIELERFALGIDHNNLGAWLMRSWNMPNPIIDVVNNHHNPHYRGDNYKLNLLTYLSDCLLGKLGIGFAAQKQTYSDELLDDLGLSVEAIEKSIDSLYDNLENIIMMAEMITE
jgi:HD-like signal output (HDOD) protein